VFQEKKNVSAALFIKFSIFPWIILFLSSLFFSFFFFSSRCFQLTTEIKIKGLFLSIWRHIQSSVQDHMRGYGTMAGGGFNTYKGALLRGTQVRNNFKLFDFLLLTSLYLNFFP
jgi:hypothetical protein